VRRKPTVKVNVSETAPKSTARKLTRAPEVHLMHTPAYNESN